MRTFHWAALTIAALLLAVPVFAQAPSPAPAPVPDAMPFDIPYGTPISLERAKQVAEAAMAEAKKRNWKNAIAVVGTAGDLVYFVKMDGDQLASGSPITGGLAGSVMHFASPIKAEAKVGDDQVGSLVSIEIGSSDGPRHRPRGVIAPGIERAVAVAQQH